MQLKQLQKESLKKVQAWTGFEPMGELVISWVCNMPVKDE